MILYQFIYLFFIIFLYKFLILLIQTLLRVLYQILSNNQQIDMRLKQKQNNTSNKTIGMGLYFQEQIINKLDKIDLRFDQCRLNLPSSKNCQIQYQTNESQNYIDSQDFFNQLISIDYQIIKKPFNLFQQWQLKQSLLMKNKKQQKQINLSEQCKFQFILSQSHKKQIEITAENSLILIETCEQIQSCLRRQNSFKNIMFEYVQDEALVVYQQFQIFKIQQSEQNSQIQQMLSKKKTSYDCELKKQKFTINITPLFSDIQKAIIKECNQQITKKYEYLRYYIVKVTIVADFMIFTIKLKQNSSQANIYIKIVQKNKQSNEYEQTCSQSTNFKQFIVSELQNIILRQYLPKQQDSPSDQTEKQLHQVQVCQIAVWQIQKNKQSEMGTSTISILLIKNNNLDQTGLSIQNLVILLFKLHTLASIQFQFSYFQYLLNKASSKVLFCFREFKQKRLIFKNSAQLYAKNIINLIYFIQKPKKGQSFEKDHQQCIKLLEFLIQNDLKSQYQDVKIVDKFNKYCQQILRQKNSQNKVQPTIQKVKSHIDKEQSSFQTIREGKAKQTTDSYFQDNKFINLMDLNVTNLNEQQDRKYLKIQQIDYQSEEDDYQYL